MTLMSHEELVELWHAETLAIELHPLANAGLLAAAVAAGRTARGPPARPPVKRRSRRRTRTPAAPSVRLAAFRRGRLPWRWAGLCGPRIGEPLAAHRSRHPAGRMQSAGPG